MTIVVGLALAGLVALVVAIMTGSTLVAVVVIALAALGIVLLLRDWRAEKKAAGTPDDESSTDEQAATVAAEDQMSADMFSPDISADGNGPSSDARAD